jgi:hypothetical protein
MYESEDSWEDVPQKPLPETSVADSVMAAGESGDETQEVLRVPKDEAKSGGTAAKKEENTSVAVGCTRRTGCRGDRGWRRFRPA